MDNQEGTGKANVVGETDGRYCKSEMASGQATTDNTEPNPSGFCSNVEKLGIDIKQSSQNGSVHHNTVRKMNAGGIYVDGWDAGSNGIPTLNHVNIYSNHVKMVIISLFARVEPRNLSLCSYL